MPSCFRAGFEANCLAWSKASEQVCTRVCEKGDKLAYQGRAPRQRQVFCMAMLLRSLHQPREGQSVPAWGLSPHEANASKGVNFHPVLCLSQCSVEKVTIMNVNHIICQSGELRAKGGLPDQSSGHACFLRKP